MQLATCWAALCWCEPMRGRLTKDKKIVVERGRQHELGWLQTLGLPEATAAIQEMDWLFAMFKGGCTDSAERLVNEREIASVESIEAGNGPLPTHLTNFDLGFVVNGRHDDPQELRARLSTQWAPSVCALRGTRSDVSIATAS